MLKVGKNNVPSWVESDIYPVFDSWKFKNDGSTRYTDVELKNNAGILGASSGGFVSGTLGGATGALSGLGAGIYKYIRNRRNGHKDDKSLFRHALWTRCCTAQ